VLRQQHAAARLKLAHVLILGWLHTGVPSNRLELNGRVAATLSSPVLAVIDARAGATAGSLFNIASIAIDNLRGCGAEVLGVALNRVCPNCFCHQAAGSKGESIGKGPALNGTSVSICTWPCRTRQQ